MHKWDILGPPPLRALCLLTIKFLCAIVLGMKPAPWLESSVIHVVYFFPYMLYLMSYVVNIKRLDKKKKKHFSQITGSYRGGPFFAHKLSFVLTGLIGFLKMNFANQ